MTASNLEPPTSTSATSTPGECTTPQDVTDRVTSPSPRELSKRVTVSGESHGGGGGEKEVEEENDASDSARCASSNVTEAKCCRDDQDETSSRQPGQSRMFLPAPFESATRYPIQVAATHKQQYPPEPSPRPPHAHAISIYPQAHNYVNYPFASVPQPPPLGQPPPQLLQPQLSFYHHQPPPPPLPPFFTWTCPITGSYHYQLPGPPPPQAGGHVYYQHHHQAQPFVVQHHHHHQLGGPAIYQSASATAAANYRAAQYVTQTPAPPDKGQNDDKCQSHGPLSSPINQISSTRNSALAIGSSAAAAAAVAASLDYANCAQQSDKSSSALPLPLPQQQPPEQPEPLDTAALLAACGPIRRNDKDNRVQAPSCAQQLNKISYQNDNTGDVASSQSELEGGSEAEEDDDDDEERGSCRRSSLCDCDCDCERGEQATKATEATATATRPTPESAGNSDSTLASLLCSRHQTEISDTTSTSASGACDGGGGSTCSSEANPETSTSEPYEDQSRVNLMVEPTHAGRGGGDDTQADCEEEEADDRAPLLKDAILDEPQSVDIIGQQQQQQQQQRATAPTTTESHQISINGTTFYNVDPARLFPPPALQYQQHQQLPFLLSYHNLGPPPPPPPHLANAYHTSHAPATSYNLHPTSQRVVPQLGGPYVASYQHRSAWCSANSHNRLMFQVPAPVPQPQPQPPPPPTVGYPVEWLHHTMAYQQPLLGPQPPLNQHLFAQPQPYLGPLRPTIYHHSHTNDQAQTMPPPPLAPAPPIATNTTSVSQLKLGYNLIPLLPIQAIPTRVRQAYGMDKVWQDEFEQMFAQFISQVVWTLVEVETNPNVRASSRILDYKSRYIVRVDGPPPAEVAMSSSTCASSGDGESEAQEDEDENEREDECCEEGEEEEDRETTNSKQVEDEEEEEEEGEQVDEDDDSCSLNQGQSHLMNERASNCESDCDSGAVLNSSTSGSTSFETTCCQAADELTSNTSSDSSSPNTRSFTPMTEVGGKVQSAGSQLAGARKFPLKFRMFIDSAKVRFCCETCGHGWTSMKGRVVFWYELFELVDGDQSISSSAPFKYPNEQQQQQQHGVSNLIGYCAYKLFGQQCDVCKVENRFERPMWYPEEVTKVLCNLYNKIGQVYFGFRMPTIDKQRRAGKPKTSHNSLLCQACHDGVCTDRK